LIWRRGSHLPSLGNDEDVDDGKDAEGGAKE
jgi:hypothetical protein